MTQKAIIYCRVSTEEQAREGFSLDVQEKYCRNFAQHNDFRIAGVYRDEGKSGTTLDRPALKDLLEKCQQDKSIEAVVIQETDRLARNTKDHLTIKALLQKAEVKLISVAQPMLDDSPEGNMIDTIIASVNQFQSDINSRKTKKSLQEKFDEGWWPGWAPFGYINAPAGNDPSNKTAKKIIKKDPGKWLIIRMGFKMYLTGHYSVDELTDILYQKGLRSRYGGIVPHSVMTFALRNPFYAGIMKWNGQVKKGKHPAMITQNEHQRILQIMDAHNLHVCRRRKHSFLLRGFIFCNICGQRYTAEKHSKKNIEYYHCSATRKKHSNLGQNVKVTDLEKQVEEYFKNIQFSQEFIEKVVIQVKNLYHYQKEKINQRKQAFYNRKMALEKKRDIVEEKLFEGLISDDDFVRVRDRIRTDLEQIQDEVDKLEDQREYDIQVFEKVLKLTRNVYKAYTEATDLLKRCFIGLFWEKFLVQDKKIVSAIPTKLICALQEKDKVIIEGNWLPLLDELRTFDWRAMRVELDALVSTFNISLA